jgi:hypothetical protein
MRHRNAAMAPRTARFALLALLVTVGCDSTGETSGASTTPMTIKIASPTEGACVDVPTDQDVNIPVTLQTTGITLQAPGTCGATVECGYIRLSVGGVPNNSGSAQVIDLLSTVAAPIAGKIDLTATLVDDAGTAFTGTDGAPIAASVTFEAKASCTGTGGTGGM